MMPVSARARRVDPASAPLYVSIVCLMLGSVVTACTAGAASVGAPDAQVAERLESATAPTRRAQITFDWNMTDRDARFSGRGVLRLDTAYRVRVDLFGPGGETLAAAIVEDRAMRVVPANAEQLLPPPAFLWATIGVFLPPVDAPLTGTGVDGSDVVLTYARDDVAWRFEFRADRLAAVEWTAGNARRTVSLTGSTPAGLPEQAVFRDWTEFRELTMRVTEVEERAAFEPDVWILPGER